MARHSLRYFVDIANVDTMGHAAGKAGSGQPVNLSSDFPPMAYVAALTRPSVEPIAGPA